MTKALLLYLNLHYCDLLRSRQPVSLALRSSERSMTKPLLLYLNLHYCDLLRYRQPVSLALVN